MGIGRLRRLPLLRGAAYPDGMPLTRPPHGFPPGYIRLKWQNRFWFGLIALRKITESNHRSEKEYLWQKN